MDTPETILESGEHARLSPSSAERWMTCPRSVQMESRFPDSTSESSSEGTAAHWVREQCLVTGKDAADFIGQKVIADGLAFEVTAAWADWLQPGVDRIREAAGEWVFEYRVNLEPWIPNGFGTLDAGGIAPDLITIDDLKFGRGVIVDARRNKQLMIYALGFWMNYARHRTEAREFLLRVDQPRVPGGGSEWRVTLDELLEFAEEVAEAALATLDPDARIQPTPDGCRFCRAARNAACFALDQFVLDLLGLTLDDLDASRTKEPLMIEYQNLDPERRSYLLAHSKMISSWLSALHSAALDDAIHGRPTPGYKAVATLGDRAWADPAAAEEFFKGRLTAKEMYTQKLKSPAQMEAVVGTRVWNKAKDLIVRPDGKPALVPEDDPRPALTPLHELLEDLDDVANLDIDDLI